MLLQIVNTSDVVMDFNVFKSYYESYLSNSLEKSLKTRNTFRISF